MNNDSHIVRHHEQLKNLLTENKKLSISSDKIISIVSQNEDAMSHFSVGLTEALGKVTKEGQELFILMNSHGSSGSVCHFGKSIQLKNIAESLSSILISHERSRPAVKINFVYSACHAGSLEKEMKKQFKVKEVTPKSKITIIMSSPNDELSHSFILSKYLENASHELNIINKQDIPITFCNDCNHFDKIAKLIAANNYDDTDTPVIWSNNSKIDRWDFKDRLILALHGQGIRKSPGWADAFISNHDIDTSGTNFRNIQDLNSLGINDPEVIDGSFIQYMVSKFPRLTLKHWKMINKMDQMDLLYQRQEKITWLKNILKNPELSPLFKGLLAGWMSKNSKLRESALAELAYFRNGENQYSKINEMARLQTDKVAAKVRFDLNIKSNNLISAISELAYMNDIPLKYSYSASPLNGAYMDSIEQFKKWIYRTVYNDPNKIRELEDSIIKSDNKSKKHILEFIISKFSNTKLFNFDNSTTANRLLIEMFKSDLTRELKLYNSISDETMLYHLNSLKKSGVLNETEYAKALKVIEPKPSYPVSQIISKEDKPEIVKNRLQCLLQKLF